MDYKAKILRNLSGRINHVSPHTAVSGIDDIEAYAALTQLVTEGKVERILVNAGTDKFGRQVRAPLYRPTPNYGEIVSDNHPHLKLVK